MLAFLIQLRKYTYLNAMKLQSLFNLQPLNSFAVTSTCSIIYYPQNLADLEALPPMGTTPYYVLGEGSNTLFVDENAPTIIKPEFKGIKVAEHDDYYIVEVAAGENWHNLVEYCLNKGIYGLENLALIPGSVGAAPVQNIGAYGVEFADFCSEVTWFEFENKKLHVLSHEACEFSYRHSLFKQRLKNKGVITQVTLKFPKQWQPVLSYQGLDKLSVEASAEEVMLKVIALREAKLPDHTKLPNAGSFFKNPEISIAEYKLISDKYPDLPFYPLDDDRVKIAAGWLIDQCGLKGFTQNHVGVHNKQALVLVNYKSTKGQDIVNLAAYVKKRVWDKFSIALEPEVRAVYHRGEAQMKLEK